MRVLQSVSDRDFDAVIEASAAPVLVEFWKPGCGHCRALMAELGHLQDEMGSKLLILTMNVEENFQIPAELDLIASRAGVLSERRICEIHRRAGEEGCDEKAN